MKTLNDPELGAAIKIFLQNQRLAGPFEYDKVKIKDLGEVFAKLIYVLGGNLEDESISDTPDRLRRMYAHEICSGLNYDNFPRIQLQSSGGLDEIVLERSIKVHSLCEHHFVPIIGVAHVAYIPTTHIIGLSKINRVVDFFSRQPQVQERLGMQIGTTISKLLHTPDVAVVIRADHFCTKYRGVEDPCSDTVTSVMSGRFRGVPELRAELMSLIAL